MRRFIRLALTVASGNRRAMAIRAHILKRSWLAAMAAAAPLLLAPGCATRAEVGMEAPGRPAVTWKSDDTVSSKAADPDVERALMAELREAERKGDNPLALAGTLYNLAILRRQQHAFAEADRLYRRALEIREREEGPNHPDVAATLNNLAALEAAQGKYDAAQPLCARALAIRETALGSEHVLTAESLNNLALLYAAQGNATAAEPLYQRARAILEKAGGTKRDELGRVLDNYAALLRDTGRDSEAEKVEAQARVVRAAESPERALYPDSAW